MKQRFILFRRAGIYYAEDTVSRKQSSLRTKDQAEALTLLNAKNESFRQPVLNLQIARAYLTATDPAMGQRPWQMVMEQMQTHGKESTKTRCACAMKSKAFDRLRRIKLLETTAEDFLTILNGSKVSVAHYLRRIHNLDEHQRILAAEKNWERNLFYQLLWEIGSSQSDAAMLTAECIDWQSRSLTYFRMKTGERAQLAISENLAAILEQLRRTGLLFPKIATTSDNARSAEFYRRCKLLNIEGVSLHSYRYAWAERAKTCGYPERFAQEALGHQSKAVHRAYAKKAQVVIPTLEDYEKKLAAAENVIVPMPAAIA